MEVRTEVTDVAVKRVGEPGKWVEKADESFCDHVRNGEPNSCILVHRKRTWNYCDGCKNFLEEKGIRVVPR